MSTFLTVLSILSAAIDLTSFLAMLFAGGPGGVGLARLLRALAVTAAIAGLKIAVLVPIAQSFFFAIDLVYIDLMVALPLAAMIVLFAARRRSVATSVRALAWLALVALPPIGWYATFVEPFQLVAERVNVPIDPRHAPAHPLRIAVLADLQSRNVDDHLREAVHRAMAFEPHLILLPGDLIQREPDEYDEAVPQFRELLAKLDAPLGVYFVDGNTDQIERVRAVFEGTHVRMLADESVELEFAGRKIVLGGVTCGQRGYPRRDFLERFEQREGDELRILLTHYPDVVLDLEGAPGTDLTIAGHTHGGQVQLPFFGPPITLSRVPRAVAAGGLHELCGRAVYVSRGVGCERGSAPRVRFLCPPEVSLLTLEATR